MAFMLNSSPLVALIMNKSYELKGGILIVQQGPYAC